jgi:hypothetical protein
MEVWQTEGICDSEIYLLAILRSLPALGSGRLISSIFVCSHYFPISQTQPAIHILSHANLLPSLIRLQLIVSHQYRVHIWHLEDRSQH